MYVTTQEIAMTPACRALLRAPFSVLEKMFGAPVACEERFSTCWRVRSVAEPALGFRIHDEARAAEGFSLEAFRRLPFYDWWIEGGERKALEDFCRWLSAEVIRALGEKPPGRRLTDRARDRMNRLIHQGVSAADALARCAEWELTPSTGEQFAWPIRSTSGVTGIAPTATPQKPRGSRADRPKTEAGAKKPPRPRPASSRPKKSAPPKKKPASKKAPKKKTKK